MFLGAGLSALGFILAIATVDSVRDQIIEDNPGFTQGEIDTAVNIGIAIGVGVGLIGIGLWIWMALTNKRGLGWARIVATVFGGLNVLINLFGLFGSDAVGTLLALLNIALAGVILWLLYRPESNEYYSAVSAARHQWGS